MSLDSGAKLGPYEIIGLIGKGGMGEVYRARDPRIGREVAVKVLPESFTADRGRMERFEREARAAGALSHPNLVSVFDVGSAGTTPYIVMELLEGRSLREALSAEASSPLSRTGAGSLSPRRAVEIAIQAAEGLAAAHERGIIHRDLKPDNLFLTKDGRVKILDFGLARLEDAPAPGQAESLLSTEHKLTAKGQILGTVPYMSPEQVKGETLDHRTDIFSFGVILYEMLSGRRPFRGDSTPETMSAILREDPIELTEVVPNVSPSLDRIIRHCLVKDPARRFQSARDLVFDLQAETLHSRSGSGDFAAPPAGRDRRWMITLLGAALVLTAMAVAIVGMFRAGDRGTSTTGPIPMQFQQLTFLKGIEAFPTLSPDGSHIVYSARTSRGDFDLFLQRTDGQAAINLTERSTADDVHAAFSPDGGEIAFRSGLPHGGIYVIGATGESLRKVSDFGFNPSWSPDGEKIVVATEPSYLTPETKNSMSSLWIIDVETGERRLLLESDGMQPNWSPNGERIAFWSIASASVGHRDLSTISATSETPETTIVPVTNDPPLDWNPVWSGDGRFLYFGSDRNGTRNLWRVPIDESSGEVRGEPVQMTLPGRFAAHFSVARSADLVAFSAVEPKTELLAAPFDPDSGGIGAWSTVLDGSVAIHSWNVSPDGSWVVLATGPPRHDLLMIRRDGSEMRQLTNDTAIDRGPSFSPDGSQVYFYRHETDRYEIFSMSAEGGGLRRLTESEGSALWYPKVSPDGSKLLAYNENGCFIVDLTGPLPSSTTELLPNYGEARCSFWSSDGHAVVGAIADESTGARMPGVLVYWLADSRWQIIDEKSHSVVGLTDAGLLLATTEDGAHLMDLSGKKVRDVEGPLETNARLSLDGKMLFVVRTETEGDVWLATIGEGGATRQP